MLCKWLRSWLGPEFDAGGKYCIDDKSDVWERAHSNDAELWASEPDLDRLKEAGAISKSDPQAAFQIYLDLAQHGSVRAMLRVAWHYGFGKGAVVTPDFRIAADWYIRAIRAGSWMATRYYAQLLAKHRYFAECEDVLDEGVKKNWIPAFYWLAWCRLQQSQSRKTYREVKPLLEYAAGKGHPWAQLRLARCMAKGKFGLRQIPRGFKLFREQVAICVAEMEAQEKRRHVEQTKSGATEA